MINSALDGVLVLDLTAGVSGGFAGKLLSDLGAQVVMMEPDAGTSLREHVLFDYLAGGKQSVVPDSDAAFRAWLDAADVVLTDGSSPWCGAVLDDLPPQVVVVDLSAFGREILPQIQHVTLSRLMKASGLSLRYCSQIRRGEKTPHPRHWKALEGTVRPAPPNQ